MVLLKPKNCDWLSAASGSPQSAGGDSHEGGQHDVDAFVVRHQYLKILQGSLIFLPSVAFGLHAGPQVHAAQIDHGYLVEAKLTQVVFDSGAQFGGRVMF